MLQSWKRIVVLGVLIVTGLGASGFLGAPQAPLPQKSPRPPAPARGSEANPPLLVEQHFELLKEVGRPRDLAPNVRHIYRVDLKAGQLLRVAVQQAGIDVRLNLSGPSGQPPIVIDSPNSNQGEEPVLLVARRPGRYMMVVSTESGHRTGETYVIKIAEIRRATPQDRRRASALQSYYAVKDLRRTSGKNPAEFLPAFAAAARSLDTAAAPMDLRAYAWQDLGDLYRGQRLWRESLEADRNAAALFHRLGMKRREATVLTEIGRDEQNLLDVESALKHFEQARALARAVGAEKEEATASMHLGLFYADRADTWNATRHLQRAVSLRKKNQDDDGQSMALNGFGLLYMRLGENEKALKIFEDQLQNLSLSPLKRAVVLTQMGQVYVSMNQPRRAFQYFQQAYDLQSRGGDPDNQANTLVGFGLAYTRIRSFRNALDSFQKALKIFQDQNNPSSQAATFMNMGWILGSLQRYEEAQDSFKRALALVRPLKNPVVEGSVLLGFAWTERLRGNLSGAQLHGEEALKRVESTRLGLADQGQKISYLASMQDFYEFLVGVLLDQYELKESRDLLERALQVSESARSRGLLDTLGAAAASRLSPVLTPGEIQQQVLDPDTLLLEYSLGSQKSYLFLVSSREIRRFDLPPKEELEALAKQAHAALANSQVSSEMFRALQKAKELSRILIGPVASQLGNKRLLIVSSGALQLVPIGVLPDPRIPTPAAGKKLVWPQPLLGRHEIIYEPSASVLAGIRRARRRRRPASNLLAALGDAVFERDDARIPGPAAERGGGSDPERGYFDRLPGSGLEVEAITAGLPKEQILKATGFAANIDLFTSGRLKNFGTLHIATHTDYVPQRPELSVMVLSRFDARGRARQGLLRIQDVIAMDLRSDLVVLSSCSSGRGKEVRGEGIVGWPWAFLSAGASEVVMSLWDVKDESTANFMKKFYEIMSNGASSGGALRETQIQMWKAGESPKAWAGFSALGEWNVRPFFLNKTPPAVSSKDGDPRNPTETKKSPPLNSLH